MKKVSYVLNRLLFILSVCFMPLIGYSEPTDQEVILYTPYTSQSITPGESLNYDVEIINRSDRIENLTLSVQGIPGSWEPKLTAGATTIQQIAVKPEILGTDYSKNINLDFKIPLEINQGTYRFELRAETDGGRQYVLPLQVRVTEQGVFETELEVNQANMEGYADSDFNYNMTLANRTATTQNYALTASAPPGWDVRFRVRGNYATSVTVNSNENENITVNVKSPPGVEADTYTIDVRAVSGSTSDEATLETVIKGQYDIDVTTPSGRLSANVTAGGETTIPLLVRNMGSVPLRNITLSSSPPVDWSVEFDNDEDGISQLDPGEEATINAIMKASSKAIAGDYRLVINANTSEASASTNFRVTVNRSVAGGTVGILFILLVVGGISYLFKKYGRR